MSALLEAALSYAARGWSIIPIGTQKKPALTRWKLYQSQKPTEDELREWFTGRKSVGGLAVILGEVSGGLVCRDFDDEGAYEAWASSFPELAKILPTVRTARGYHVYFRSKHRGITKSDDGELRGGGYCLLPPSKHPSGSDYEWVIQLPDGPLLEIDPFTCGLFPRGSNSASPALLGGGAGDRENREIRERRELKVSKNIEQSNGSPLSALSITLTPELWAAIEAALQASLPASEGQRNAKLFEFARRLKAIPELRDLNTPQLREIVREWHGLAVGVIRTKDFDETLGDFEYGWERVRFPWGTNPLEAAMAAADRESAPQCATHFESESTIRIIKLFRELQKVAGDNVFFAAGADVAELVGLDPNSAWKRINQIVKAGIFEIAELGRRGRATRFRYLGD